VLWIDAGIGDSSNSARKYSALSRSAASVRLRSVMSG